MPCLAGMSVIHKVTCNDTFYVWKLSRNPCGMRINLSALGAAGSLPRPSGSSGLVSVQRNHFSELAEPGWLCSGDISKFNFGSSCKCWVWGCLEQLMGLEQLKPVAYGWHPTLLLTNGRNSEVKTEANNEDKRQHSCVSWELLVPQARQVPCQWCLTLLLRALSASSLIQMLVEIMHHSILKSAAAIWTQHFIQTLIFPGIFRHLLHWHRQCWYTLLRERVNDLRLQLRCIIVLLPSSLINR